MTRATVGSGKASKEFGKMTGAKEINTDKSDGIREGATKRVTSTSCGIPWYVKKKNGLAGGSRGSAANPICDQLPGETGT